MELAIFTLTMATGIVVMLSLPLLFDIGRVIFDYRIEKPASNDFTKEVEILTKEYVRQIDEIESDEFNLKVVKEIVPGRKGNNREIYGQFRTRPLLLSKEIVISERIDYRMLAEPEEVIIHELAHMLDHKNRGTSDHGASFEVAKDRINRQIFIRENG